MSQTHLALAKLRQMVFSGELPPGSNHFEADLAAKLGMSRTPVREAALTMQEQGLVDVQPRRGVRVRPLSAEDMGHIYDVLCELESLAAERAAQQHLGKDELSAMQKAVTRMDAALAREDRQEWTVADDDFHAELIRLGGNPCVAEIRAKYIDLVRRARQMTLQLRPLPVRSNQDHAELIKAIAAADPERARQIHHDHCVRSKKLMMELIKTMGMRQI